MYKKDREKLKFDIQKDKIKREYIESLNDWIVILEDALEN